MGRLGNCAVCVYSPERLVERLMIALACQAHVLAPGKVVHIGYVIVDGQLGSAIQLTLAQLISVRNESNLSHR